MSLVHCKPLFMMMAHRRRKHAKFFFGGGGGADVSDVTRIQGRDNVSTVKNDLIL